MNSADLFIFSSKYEGLPNVLLESLALKKFIISSKCPTGPREILSNGRYGFLFEPKNSEQLKDLLIKFYYNKNKMEKKTIEGFKSLKLDAIIGIGGDGSLKLLQTLTKQGNINFVGIPKTIDNDVKDNELSIGYDTAVDVATNALDMLQPTAASHRRVMILEVMGRDAGHIALNAGIAGGADVILIPEIKYSFTSIAKHFEKIRSNGRNHALIVVAESVKKENGSRALVKYIDGQVRLGGIGSYIGDKIYKLTKAETRVTVLGHVQRGAQPTHRDRLIASAFGVHAVDLIAQEKFNRVVVWQNRGVTDVDLESIAGKSKTVRDNDPLIKVAEGLGIYVGEIN